MAVKTVKLEYAYKFARNNGYQYAIYQLAEDGNYHIMSFCFTNHINLQTEIIVEIVGAGIDCNEFTTKDKQYCFRLHNNFNVPDIIPVFATV